MSSSGLLLRSHHARMNDQLLNQLAFLACNKLAEFELPAVKAELLSLQCTGCLLKNDPVLQMTECEQREGLLLFQVTSLLMNVLALENLNFKSDTKQW